MSYHFIEQRGWFATDLVRVRKDGSTSEEKEVLVIHDDDEYPLEEGSEYSLLIIDNNKEDYHKSVLEGLFNMVSKFTLHLQNGKKEYEDKLTSHNLTPEMTFLLKDLGHFIGYLPNTGSWTKGSIQEYDRQELIKRLERVLDHIKSKP